MNNKIDSRSFGLIRRYLKGFYHLFVFALICSVCNTILNAMTPQIFRFAVDGVLGGDGSDLPAFAQKLLANPQIAGAPLKALTYAGVAVVLVAAFSGLCSYGFRMSTTKGSEGFVKALRDSLYAHIQKLPFSWHVGHQTGEIIQRCTSDVDVVRNFVTNQLIEVVRIVFLLAFSLSIMFSMNVKMALIAAAFIPVVLAYSGIFYAKISSRFRDADEAEGYLSSTVQENLTGVRVVRAFGRESFEIERFNEKNIRFSNLWIQLGKLLSLYWSLGDLITGLQIMTIISVGAFFAVNGELTLGEFLAFVSYNATLVWPVRGLGRILSEMSKAGVSIDRVAYILKAEEEKDPADAKTPPLDADIRFEDVTFCYEGAKPVLDHLSFTIPAGKTFAVLGGTGSGKSTMMHLLDRLYDLKEGEGKITVGGVDLREIRRDYLRQNIGLVLQEPFLFSRTIKENIGISRPGSGMDEIRRAAGIACVDDAIDTFTDGYDTVVGERGVTLSGGQKQRVAIARMLMQGAPVMIFDDSLSAVDAETDAKIRASLKERMGSATVILISHRITTLMQADEILVLEDGRLAQHGTHNDLIRQEGIYKTIYDIQMSSSDRELIGSAT
ncbi:MAG: ABC transporter ATP-binding protein [Oscillospiraceae bacterium]|nr:ABC transporter ATP-binding protein [Oscillospiraceae bacterium]